MIEKFLDHVVKFGSFTLSSGLESPFYVDMRVVLGQPDLLKWVVERYVDLLNSSVFDVVVGVATGGLPYASIVGYLLNRPIAYVRPEAKTYGSKRRVEGADVAQKRVVVIDDVLTTGRSLSAAIKTVEEEGGRVVGAVVFLDRQQCGVENVKAATGVEVRSVYKMWDLLNILKNRVGDVYYNAAVEYLSRWRC